MYKSQAHKAVRQRNTQLLPHRIAVNPLKKQKLQAFNSVWKEHSTDLMSFLCFFQMNHPGVPVTPEARETYLPGWFKK